MLSSHAAERNTDVPVDMTITSLLATGAALAGGLIVIATVSVSLRNPSDVATVNVSVPL
ncbi:hypothetical protein D9M70_525780 [compost metagenome]